MEFKWKIFLVVLLFALAVGALSNLSLFLFRMLNFGPEALSWVSIAVNMVTFLISPLLLFACFYIMGQKIDLATDFPSIALSLFLGAWIGHLIGSLSLQFISYALYGGASFVSWILWVMWYSFIVAFSLEFFVAFAALSMAYIVRKRSMQTGA